MIVVSDKLSTETFHAFIDEQLTDEQYAQVEAQLDEIPEKIEEIQQCHIINERLREVFDPVVEEPVPDDLYKMGLYGPADDVEEDSDQYHLDSSHFGYDYDEHAPDAGSGYEHQIETPLESMDDALDLQDEEFIEGDNEFADLEALSDESMADFDIDAMAGNENDIIPDIFDPQDDRTVSDNTLQARRAVTPEAADMLDSLESLSLEPEESTGKTAAQQQSIPPEPLQPERAPMPQPAGHNQPAMPIEPPELELEPLDDALDAQSTAEPVFTPATDPKPQPGPAASEEVLHTLESSEELTLAPLDEPMSGVDNQSPETDPPTETVTLESSPSSQEPSALSESEPSALSESEPSADLQEPSADLQEPSADSRQPSTVDSEVSQSSPSAEPQDMSAEPPELPVEPGLAPSLHHVTVQAATGNDLPAEKPRKVLGGKQAQTSAADMNMMGAQTKSQPSPAVPEQPAAEVEPHGLNRQADATRINYQHSSVQRSTVDDLPVDEIAEELDGISDDKDTAPGDVVAEFFAEKKANPDFEVHEVVKEFEEVSEKFDQPPASTLSQELFDSPVEFIKQKANGLLHDVNSRFAQIRRMFARDRADLFPDFNAPPLDYYQGAAHVDEPMPAEENIPPMELPSAQAPAEPGRRQAPPQARNQVDSEKAEPLFDNESGAMDFDIAVDETPDQSGSLTTRIGETLKHYKQKLAQAQTGAFDSDSEPRSALHRFRQMAARWYAGLSVENRGTLGGVVLLFVGLLIGGSVASLFGQSAPAIADSQVEQLAIDAHILYTQQDQNFAGNSTISITESMQWLSARIGKSIRLADVDVDGFEYQRAIVMPTLLNYATANIFRNKDKQKMTLFVAASAGDISEAPLTCRIPTAVDGLCSWITDSVHYVVVANLSLSRVRAFSQSIIQQL